MPRATCRCGQVLSIPVNGPERVICPKCQARVRVRRDTPKVGPGDGFLRFVCPCGRRLKVRIGSATEPTPQAGKCPDCGRVVPVPTASSSSGALRIKPTADAETPTEEMSAEDLEALGRWVEGHLSSARAEAQPETEPAYSFDPERQATAVVTPPPLPAPADEPVTPPPVKAEAGLRVCPRCGRPVHLSAVACRECGAPVPRR